MIPAAWLIQKLKAEERKRKEAQDSARIQLPIPTKELPLKV
jgi:hypothetical protein